MKVRTATLLFAAVIFGLFVLLGVSLTKMTSLLDREAKDIATAGTSISAAQELKSYLLIHNRNAFLYSLNGNPGRLESNLVLRREITRLLARMRRLVTQPGEQAVFAELETEIASYLEKRDRLDAAGLSAIDQYTEVRKDVDQTLAVVDRLIEINEEQMDLLINRVENQNRMADRIAFLLLAIGGVVLLTLIGTMFFYIAQPLKAAASTISRFGSGNDAVRVQPARLAEIRQIGASFNAMADRLEEKQKEQLRFIAAIAHDLRNPLNSMSMASELLVRKCSPEDKKWADTILRQVKNLDRMVGDLLDTTRIEAGRVDLQLSVHDMNALITDSVQLHKAGSDLHRFIVETPDEPVFCLCDGGRITQVINNLISNAVKYSPNGGDVTVQARRDEDEIRISVSDQGIGIAPEEVDNLFTPFYRTKATRGTIPGIGLGLSASRHIVESHGGKLRVQSNPGAGSTFYFTLPARTAGTVAFQDKLRNALPPRGPVEKARGAVNDRRGSETEH